MDNKVIPTLIDIYQQARVSELEKRRNKDLAQQNTPPAAPIPALGEKKPLIRLADIHQEGKNA